MRLTWYTFGGMDSWMGLALVVGAISAMDIFRQLRIHVITFGSGFFVLGISVGTGFYDLLM